MRLLIFTDSNTTLTAGLIKTTTRLAREHGLEVCGIVTRNPNSFRFSRRRRARYLARHALVAATNATVQLRRDRTRPVHVRWMEHEGIPLLEARNPNDPAFVKHLRDDVHPDVALSYVCATIFKTPLLQAFQQTVNFHNGLLPRYKGLMATSFSIYAGEAETGFTFHRMTEGIDAGPILLQGRVPIGAGDDVRAVVRKLADKAIASVPDALDRVLERAPGLPQDNTGSYFSRRDYENIVRVDHPEALAEAELHRRIRAFQTVSIAIDGRRYPVTRLRHASRADRLSFRTADGSTLRPARIRQLPPALNRARPRLR